MYIYRVEDPDTGKGPYNPAKDASMEKHLLDDDISDAHNDTYHPTMFDDCCFDKWYRFSDEASNYYAGCKSVEQLHSWFSSFWPRLNDTGYTIRIYDCPDTLVKSGTYQVCFPLAAAKLIDEMAISDFLAIVE